LINGEGCKPLASISLQRFFRSYRELAGMGGTMRDVAIELSAIYGLSLTRIARRRPRQLKFLGRKVVASREQVWKAAVRLIERYHNRGQPVLIGVRSEDEAQLGSDALTRHGITHAVLGAAHDRQGPEIVARAGQRGAVTIVTNMAGRGTDIKLGSGVVDLGGLVVMLCERHDARRLDRQLMGRCARRGEPGMVVEVLSRKDAVLKHANTTLLRLAGMYRQQWTLDLPFRYAQWRVERESAWRRFALVRRDERPPRK
jgi:preprotein translocase subunit SecA